MARAIGGMFPQPGGLVSLPRRRKLCTRFWLCPEPITSTVHLSARKRIRCRSSRRLPHGQAGCGGRRVRNPGGTPGRGRVGWAEGGGEEAIPPREGET